MLPKTKIANCKRI